MDRDDKTVTSEYNQQLVRTGSTFQSKGMVKSQTADPAARSAEARALVLHRRDLALARRETALLRRGGNRAPAVSKTLSYVAVANTATATPEMAKNKRTSAGGALVLLAGEYAHPARYRLRVE